VIIRDWHAIPAATMAKLYEREASRWAIALGWNMTSAWTTVEVARTTWGLPGLVCTSDDGRIQGWTFYMAGNAGVDVGGLAADSEQVTAALVDALIARAGSPSRLHGLLYATAPSLLHVVGTRGVPCVRYSYRRRALIEGETALRPRPHDAAESATIAHAFEVSPWSSADLDETAALLCRSYDGLESPIGCDTTKAQWTEYLSKLILHDGCGAFSNRLSLAARAQGVPVAVSLASAIGPQSAHLIQLAVDPRVQRSGLGRALLARTMELAQAEQCMSLSLLVSETNRPGLRLYRGAGFVERGVFVRLGSQPDAALGRVPASRIA
jgi:ribosomal protein S18 acetylase RimI-like enzyme